MYRDGAEGEVTPVCPTGVLRAPAPCAVRAQLRATVRAAGRGGKGQRMLWYSGSPWGTVTAQSQVPGRLSSRTRPNSPCPGIMG